MLPYKVEHNRCCIGSEYDLNNNKIENLKTMAMAQSDEMGDGDNPFEVRNSHIVVCFGPHKFKMARTQVSAKRECRNQFHWQPMHQMQVEEPLLRRRLLHSPRHQLEYHLFSS